MLIGERDIWKRKGSLTTSYPMQHCTG